jgi:UDP-glucose 4-epimerase
MNRIIVIGATGFIGRSLCQLLQQSDKEYVGLGSKEVDLLNPQSIHQLSKLIGHGDVVINLAAISPTKDVDTLLKNLIMANNFVKGCGGKKLKKLIIISSDAVYGDNSGTYSESSSMIPDTFHGIMHMTREMIFRQVESEIHSIVRPTNVYGVGDPHNSYGPNRFIREALGRKEINIFGKGKSTRDFIYVEDVAKIIFAVMQSNNSITINAVTGFSVSFKDIALGVISEIGGNIVIRENGAELVESQKQYDISSVLKLLNNQLPINIFQGLTIYLNKLKSSENL